MILVVYHVGHYCRVSIYISARTYTRRARIDGVRARPAYFVCRFFQCPPPISLLNTNIFAIQVTPLALKTLKLSSAPPTASARPAERTSDINGSSAAMTTIVLLVGAPSNRSITTYTQRLSRAFSRLQARSQTPHAGGATPPGWW